MGGVTKKPLSAMEKAQRRASRKGEERKTEKRQYSYLAPVSEEEVLKEITRMRVVTPLTVSERFELRLSRSRQILRRLCEKGALRLLCKNREFEVYVPAR